MTFEMACSLCEAATAHFTSPAQPLMATSAPPATSPLLGPLKALTSPSPATATTALTSPPPLTHAEVAAALHHPDELIIRDSLPPGGIAQAYIASTRDHPALRFVKKTVRKTLPSVHDMEEEYRLQRVCAGPYVPDVYRLIPATAEHGSTLVMEYVNGLDLIEVFAVAAVPEATTRAVLRTVGAALLRCHSLGVIHQDVKPDNIVRCRLAPERFVLIDFGHAVAADAHGHGACRASTREYMAPEAGAGSTFVTTAVDVWSLGLTLLALLTGKDINKAYLSHIAPETFVRQHVGRRVSFKLQRVIARMLRWNYSDRVTLRQLQDEGWIEGNNTP